jgi:hypothetical protein
VIEEPQEGGALILVGGCWAMQRKANGFWYLLNQRDGDLDEISWADVVDKWAETHGADRSGVIQLHQGEAGPTLRRELAIRVDEEHPSRKEKRGTVIAYWNEEHTAKAPEIWGGWTLVERWVTEWRTPE